MELAHFHEIPASSTHYVESLPPDTLPSAERGDAPAPEMLGLRAGKFHHGRSRETSGPRFSCARHRDPPSVTVTSAAARRHPSGFRGGLNCALLPSRRGIMRSRVRPCKPCLFRFLNSSLSVLLLGLSAPNKFRQRYKTRVSASHDV